MTETSFAAWMGERTEQETPAQKIYRQAMQAAGRQERAELAADLERAAAVEDERDRRLLALRQVGISAKSLEETFAEAARIGDEDEEFEAAAATMARIERHRQRRVEATRSEMAQLAAVASRSVPADPFEAARQRAHRAFAEVTRAKMSESALAPERGRPFGRGGVARRTEPVTCRECLAVGADSTESFLIHHDPELGRDPAVPVPAAAAHCPGCGYLWAFCDCNGAAGRAGDRDYGLAVR